MPGTKSISFDNIGKFVEIGYNIAYYRKHNNLTQEKLAEKIGISRSHLSAIEAPNIIRPFSIEILLNIASVLDIEPYKLLVFHNK